ncbi:hypothetical protein F4818DRAFT_441725 [Hypoxylon cercidicola]|nr:hypothetical protein F4818DRAFT_441725 [Hypoxylon cercidicola]
MAKEHHPGHLHVHENPRGTKRWTRICFALLTVLAFLATAVLGVFVMVGCVSTSPAISNLFLAELRVNKTYDIHLRLGYFGGCVMMSTLPSPAGPDDASNELQSHCVMNMRASDVDDLNEEFWEKLNLVDDPKAQLQDALDGMLPVAKHLQADVFNWEPPLVSFLLFIVSSIMLLVGATAASQKRRYKATLLTSVLFSAFAVALALVTDIGSRQAANALLNGDMTVDSQALGDDMFIQRTGLQYIIQDASAACTILFYMILGIIFVRRSPEDRKSFGFPQFTLHTHFQH